MDAPIQLSQEPSDALRGAVLTVNRGVLMPTLMACPDLPALLQLIEDAYFYRLVQDRSLHKLPENFQSGRSDVTEDRAKLAVRELFTPYIRAVMQEAIALLQSPGQPGSRPPVARIDDLLRQAGLHLGVHERNRVLSGLEASAQTPSAQTPSAETPSVGPDGPLFCFLGALLPVVMQRFQAVPGSLLWYGGQTLPPDEMRAFLQTLERELLAWLESHAVHRDAIPQGSEDAHVLLELSVLGGVPAPIDWSPAVPPWAKLICATVGGDVAVRIGNLDQAMAVLQRESMDAAYAIYHRLRQKGDRIYDFIPRRYQVMSPNTITKWRKGPGLDEKGQRSPVNGGFAGASAIQIQQILATLRPGMVSRPRLLAQLRERCRGPMASPEIVDMALHMLLQEDRIVWTRNARGEDSYGMRETHITMTAERLKQMQASLERDISVVPGLVRANVEGHPGGHVFSHRRWIRRTHLEGSQEAIRQIRERVREQFTRKYDEIPKEAWPEHGIEECRAFLLSRVSPVPPR